MQQFSDAIYQPADQLLILTHIYICNISSKIQRGTAIKEQL